MKLDKVQIKNFRSIKDETISFEPRCRILVGVNESGKSNILKALALLDESVDIDQQNNIREILPNEDDYSEAFVRFTFNLNDDEKINIYNKALENIFYEGELELIKKRDEIIDFREICFEREALYEVDILRKIKYPAYWNLRKEYKIVEGWKKVKIDIPESMSKINDKVFIFKKHHIIHNSIYSKLPAAYLEDLNIDDVNRLIGAQIIEIFKQNKPNVIFWQYEEKFLLPNSVNIKTFSNDPGTCRPLENMFLLSNITDIKKSIEEARSGSKNKFQNFLDKIANKITIHFRDVWKEYNNIEFSLKADGDDIIPGIKELNTHDLQRRSDGFKRFVTFLLMISVNVKSEKLKNTLLLVDEADITLHPSGIRYLRDELIKISEKNYVIFSTHSIFMIDTANIDRHYLVSKENEITNIEQAGESNINDEEVIYNALGFSVFSVLNQNNLIFEGWNDKRIYQVYMQQASSTLQKKFKNVGECHANGVKSIKSVMPIIDLAKRNCIIISDSDEAAREQKKLYEKEKGYGIWFTYQDIDSSLTEITGEDFIKNSVIIEKANAILPEYGIQMLDESILRKSNKINDINTWLISKSLSKEKAKECLKQIKDKIYEDLEPSDIEASYGKLLKGISFN